MKTITKSELDIYLKDRPSGKHLDLSHLEFENMDLRDMDLSNISFDLSVFRNVTFDKSDLSYSSFENALLDDCSLYEVSFEHAFLKGCSMRRCNLEGACLKGADLFSAILEKANLDRVSTDSSTKWFQLRCPKKGAFIGYKKCLYDRIVTLYIPEDAKRTSATLPTCRCSKAKVLRITNFDDSERYTEAWSLADENFVYRLGEWVEVLNFNEDRWMDSTTGIHFWMNREEALNY